MGKSCYELRLLPSGGDARNTLDSELGVRSRGQPRDGWRHLGFLSSPPSEELKRRFLGLAGGPWRGNLLRLSYDLVGSSFGERAGHAYWLATGDSSIVLMNSPEQGAAEAYEGGDAKDLFPAVYNLTRGRGTHDLSLRLMADLLEDRREHALRDVVLRARKALVEGNARTVASGLYATTGCLSVALGPWDLREMSGGHDYPLEESWFARRVVCEALHRLETVAILRELPRSLVLYHSLVREGGVWIMPRGTQSGSWSRWAARGETLFRGLDCDASEAVYADLAARMSRLYPLGELLLARQERWGRQ